MQQSKSGSLSSSTFVKGIREIVDQYDAFIIDQWGVLHNGKIPYPCVVACLQELCNRKKPMILLSNSSRRKQESYHGLQKVSIDPSLFLDIVTSGDAGWHLLKDRQFSFNHLLAADIQQQVPLKVYLIGNGEDNLEYLQSSNCVMVGPEEADLILVRGTFTIYHTVSTTLRFPTADDLIDAIPSHLSIAIQRKLPMLITNPDFCRPDASQSPMPGQVGIIYQQLLQAAYPELANPQEYLQYIGKPYPEVYKQALLLLPPNNQQRICCIGDSLEHDILGANNNGLDSLWIVNGIHSKELEQKQEMSDHFPVEEKMIQLIERMNNKGNHRNCIPTYSIPNFKW